MSFTTLNFLVHFCFPSNNYFLPNMKAAIVCVSLLLLQVALSSAQSATAISHNSINQAGVGNSASINSNTRANNVNIGGRGRGGNALAVSENSIDQKGAFNFANINSNTEANNVRLGGKGNKWGGSGGALAISENDIDQVGAFNFANINSDTRVNNINFHPKY
eukprot:GILK01016227.1.p1 GENE.GILK01016227.1~~GILK01016227.1.p1  ORF type:complete len:163 (+),score=18.16 GILK01016227.1:206-694(+)